MKKILVLRGGALGDLIVTLPALALLRDRWPEAKITVVGNSTAALLGREAGLVDQVESQHAARWAALYGPAPLPTGFARELREFDLVVNFWPDPDGDIARRFPARSGQQFLSGAALPARAPAAAHYCAPLEAIGLETLLFWHRLGTPAPTARRIALHPGSGSRSKNWPLERWIELAAWLQSDFHAELLIITGEADAAAAQALATYGEAIRGQTLPDLVQRFRECRLFLGHDSGISHLAAACAVPSILLFGPTDPDLWAPPAPHVTVIRQGATLDSISLSHVQQAARTALAAGN